MFLLFSSDAHIGTGSTENTSDCTNTDLGSEVKQTWNLPLNISRSLVLPVLWFVSRSVFTYLQYTGFTVFILCLLWSPWSYTCFLQLKYIIQSVLPVNMLSHRTDHMENEFEMCRHVFCKMYKKALPKNRCWVQTFVLGIGIASASIRGCIQWTSGLDNQPPITEQLWWIMRLVCTNRVLFLTVIKLWLKVVLCSIDISTLTSTHTRTHTWDQNQWTNW